MSVASRKPFAPGTADRLERLAKKSVQPIKPSVAIPTPAKPKNWWDDEPTPAAKNVPGNKPFVGPTLDPEVILARSELASKASEARAAGIPESTVTAIETGKGDPNRGFIGVGKGILNVAKGIGGTVIPDVIPGTRIDISDILEPVGKTVGKGAATVGVKLLTAASPAIDKLDFGRRLVTSTLKEVGDQVAVWRGTRERGQAGQGEFRGKGGFSASDWWNQLSKEGGISGGEFFADYKNPYVNQTLGFMADVFLDPLTYATGPGGIAKTAATRGAITGGTRQGANIAVRVAAAEADQFAAATARKIAQETLDDAIRIGDNVLAKSAEEAIAKADKQLANAAKKLSGDAAGRTYGRTSNQALASNVVNLRDEAQRTIDLGTAPAGELAYAERFVEVITDDVIKNIQSSGLAGIAGPFWDIVKGVRTPAQDILGVRGGIRFYNPLEVFGKGPLRVTVPGTERFTNVAGKILANSRLRLGNTPLGAKVINNITPTGEGGILGSQDLLELRTGLRRGTLSPLEAQEATRLLQLDQQYRALVNNERKVAQGTIAKSGLGNAKKFDRETLKEVVRLRQLASAAGVAPAFTPVQQAANDAIDAIFDNFYSYAARASSATGYVPPRRANYFPQMQSDEAIRWATANQKDAEKLAQALKVDRTWFVGNFRARELAPGDEFFGKVLTQADIDGGAATLNQIARKWGLKFDYFETDPLKVIAKYADKHAQFSALQKSIGSLPETMPTMAARQVGPEFVTPRPTTRMLPTAVGFSLEDINGLPLDPEPLLRLLDETQLTSLKDEIGNITTKLSAKSVDKTEIKNLVNNLQTKLDKIQDDFITGVISPMTAAVATDEVKKLAQTVNQEINRVVLNLAAVPANRWSEYSAIVKKGFEILNGDVIDPDTGKILYKGTAPDIAVREELADLLRNATRMEDPKFAARARQLVNDYTRFSKAWLTARPGFHTRNALSNTFQLIAAGADPRNLFQGNKILTRVNQGLKEGLTPRQVAKKIVDEGFLKIPIEKAFPLQSELERKILFVDAIEDAINYSGATGFGQVGEIAREVGAGNRGLRQVKEVGKVKLKKPSTYKSIPSATAGQYLKWNRKVGEIVENYSRFGLMWDGISKGLSPEEAAARANKYLIDYSDLSNVDRFVKQIIPFWTFMSRNTPLQLELLWTNPRAYAQYNSFQRNFAGPSEEEGGMVIPSYELDRGVFPLKTPINIPEASGQFEQFGPLASLIPGIGPGVAAISQFPGLTADVVKPGLPFPGGGENVVRGLITEPRKFLANINPIFRAATEAFVLGDKDRGERLFTGGPIVPASEATDPTPAKLRYLWREVFAPNSAVGALLKAMPGVNRQQWVADYFGINVDDAEPLVQQVNSALSYLGLPLGTQRVEPQVRELQNRFYKLEDYIDAKRAEEKQRIEDIQKEQPQESGKNWWED